MDHRRSISPEPHALNNAHPAMTEVFADGGGWRQAF
jgi:hypothetical protein